MVREQHMCLEQSQLLIWSLCIHKKRNLLKLLLLCFLTKEKQALFVFVCCRWKIGSLRILYAEFAHFHGEESIIQKARSRDYMFVLKGTSFLIDYPAPVYLRISRLEKMPSLVNLQLQDYCKAISLYFYFILYIIGNFLLMSNGWDRWKLSSIDEDPIQENLTPDFLWTQGLDPSKVQT